MILVLNMRPLTEEDLSRSNPFLPEHDEYEMYLQALCDELTRVDGILKVVQKGSSLSIEINELLTEEELRVRIKPALTEDMMKHFKFVSLNKR